MEIRGILVSSLEKIFPDSCPCPCPVRLTMLRGDTLSFQIALFPDCEGVRTQVRVSVDSPLSPLIQVRQVELLPSLLPTNDASDGNYLSDKPGLYPDLLRPLSDGCCYLVNRRWNALWVEIDAQASTPAGNYPVRVEAASVESSQRAALETSVEVIDALLPPQELTVTEWFHGDCIADYYRIPVFSETHWEYMRRQIQVGARRGRNMILTPVFTPPLDTQVGGERTTIQLVDVYKNQGTYSFGFEKLDRWVSMCRKCGVKYFEMAHLYTQWGAKCCPKIMGYEDGTLRKLFGWEQSAVSQEYRDFLQAFLPALIQRLRVLGIDGQTVFHISDEPTNDNLSSYSAAKAQVAGLLDGFPIVDAMSDYDFFTQGVCKNPIISTSSLTPFLEGTRPDRLWVYYCCGQSYQVSNRFFAMPSARNRIIGAQFYKYDVAGFLQWGYNFYNSRFSLRHINPFQVTDADISFPSGDSFMVYPGENGEPLESLRMLVFQEALTDLRALKLLEKLTSREHVLDLMEGGLPQPLTFTQYPHDASYLLSLRLRVNLEIKRRMEG